MLHFTLYFFILVFWVLESKKICCTKPHLSDVTVGVFSLASQSIPVLTSDYGCEQNQHRL